MASRGQSLVVASPFKTGFYAGLGFFFASILMSVIGVVFVVLLGFGTAVGVFLHLPKSAGPASAQPSGHHAVAAASDGQ